MKLIATILISSLLTFGGLIGLRKFVENNPKLGAFTQLVSTNQISNFPTTYNANLDKTIEVGTTSVASITTLSNLVSVGTITTGTWNATALSVSKGGTGTTSPSAYMVMLGDAANGLTMASSTGTSGQFFTSNGPGLYPSWQSASVNQTSDYVWSGQHTFGTTSAPTTFQNATVRMTNDSAALGIGTSTPFMALSVATNTFIGGGLAVGSGISTSTVGNVRIGSFLGVDGTTTTNGLAILGGNVCIGCVVATSTLAKVALTTTGDAIMSVTATCPGNQIVSGGGYRMIASNDTDDIRSNKYIISTNGPGVVGQYSFTTRPNAWTVVAKTVSGGGGEAGTLYAIALCVNP